jgi:hypothetical protein
MRETNSVTKTCSFISNDTWTILASIGSLMDEDDTILSLMCSMSNNYKHFLSTSKEDLNGIDLTVFNHEPFFKNRSWWRMLDLDMTIQRLSSQGKKLMSFQIK